MNLQRRKQLPTVYFFAMVGAFVYVLATSVGLSTTTGTIGGDYPAFYGVGKIVLNGDGAYLYDRQFQDESQVGLHPKRPNGYLPFAYPPFVAALYAPLAVLDFKWSYILHTFLMVAALYGAVRIIKPVLPVEPTYLFGMFVLMLGFFPILRSVIGGQNTTLTILLIAAVWRAIHDRNEIAVGMILALLLYKPQFAIPFWMLIALRSGPWLWISFSAMAALLYVMSAMVSGFDWPVSWFEHVAYFHSLDQAVNAHNSVGFTGFLEAVTRPGNALSIALGTMLSLALSLWLAVLWWQKIELNTVFAVTCAALPLIQPHAMFYDGGIAFLGVMLLLREGGNKLVFGLLLLYLFAYSTPASVVFGFSPIFPILLMFFILTGAHLFQNRAQKTC